MSPRAPLFFARRLLFFPPPCKIAYIFQMYGGVLHAARHSSAGPAAVAVRLRHRAICLRAGGQPPPGDLHRPQRRRLRRCGAGVRAPHRHLGGGAHCRRDAAPAGADRCRGLRVRPAAGCRAGQPVRPRRLLRALRRPAGGGHSRRMAGQRGSLDALCPAAHGADLQRPAGAAQRAGQLGRSDRRGVARPHRLPRSHGVRHRLHRAAGAAACAARRGGGGALRLCPQCRRRGALRRRGGERRGRRQLLCRRHHGGSGAAGGGQRSERHRGLAGGGNCPPAGLCRRGGRLRP